jgi:hypothetical protein
VVPNDKKQRFGFIYDPEAGMVRLSRSMDGRNDIPDPDTFTHQLDTLIELGVANRAAQATIPVTPQPSANSTAPASGSPTSSDAEEDDHDAS